jgi:hypothetical protein
MLRDFNSSLSTVQAQTRSGKDKATGSGQTRSLILVTALFFIQIFSTNSA